MNSIVAKRLRSTIESAKQDLDLARQQQTTSATLKQCRFVNAIQVTKAFVEAVDGGIRLPGEIVASVVFSRPMSDLDALNWWHSLAAELRKAFPNRIKGSSGMLDFPRYLKNDRGEYMGRDGKPTKFVRTKHKGPDGKTYFGCKRTGELATDRDNLDEAKLLYIERQIATDWSDLFRLLSEAVDEHATAEVKGELPKRSRGRPKGSVTSDPIADAMVANKWANGRREFATHEELADALQKPVDEVSAALKRHASRQKHDK